MSRAGRRTRIALLCASLALAGCMADAPRTEAQQSSANAVRTIEADIRATEARGTAEALASIAEADRELNRQIESTNPSAPPARRQR